MGKQVLSKNSPLPNDIMEACMNAWLASLPTTYVGLAVGKWWNNGGIPTKVLSS